MSDNAPSIDGLNYGALQRLRVLFRARARGCLISPLSAWRADDPLIAAGLVDRLPDAVGNVDHGDTVRCGVRLARLLTPEQLAGLEVRLHLEMERLEAGLTKVGTNRGLRRSAWTGV